MQLGSSVQPIKTRVHAVSIAQVVVLRRESGNTRWIERRKGAMLLISPADIRRLDKWLRGGWWRRKLWWWHQRWQGPLQGAKTVRQGQSSPSPVLWWYGAACAVATPPRYSFRPSYTASGSWCCWFWPATAPGSPTPPPHSRLAGWPCIVKLVAVKGCGNFQ